MNKATNNSAPNGNNTNSSARFERVTENLNKTNGIPSTPHSRADFKENKKGSYVLRVGSVSKRFATMQLKDNAYAALSNGRFPSMAGLVAALRSMPSGFATPNAPKAENGALVENSGKLLSVEESYG